MSLSLHPELLYPLSTDPATMEALLERLMEKITDKVVCACVCLFLLDSLAHLLPVYLVSIY